MATKPKHAAPMTSARWRREVEWVYRNLGMVELVKEPPSLGAKVLWEEARKDPKWFFSTFMAKMAPDKEQEKKQETDVGVCLEELESWWRERQEKASPA